VVAVPFFVDAKGVRINPKSLVYTWRILDRVPEGSSGVGRDTFVWTARAPFRATEIEVEAATPDGEAVARAKIVARAAPAQALLYEAHPLYGMLWNRALSSAKLMGEEMRLAVGSFFFNRRDEALLQYKWTQNSVPLVAAIGKSTAFRREGRSGRADIGVEVTNPSAMFQVGKARTVLEF
jgi:hypothetical protein